MTVNINGLRNAADFMRAQSGEDPKWLRNAADEIESLREQLATAQAAYIQFRDGYEAKLAKATAALEFIADGYDNPDVNHVDFRVKAYQAALDALGRDS